MTSPSTDRRYGLTTDAAIKVPCKVASTGILTLSGLQTVDGVALAAGDRVLVTAQTDKTTNGIYIADTGTWTRDVDFDTNLDTVTGTLLSVLSGTSWSNSYWKLTTTDKPIVLGTSLITFQQTAVYHATNMVSIKDFGADPSLADNSASIQAAINFVYGSTNGGSLYIPAGKYTYKTTLVVQSDTYTPVKIFGDGTFASILHFAPDSVVGASVGLDFKTRTGAGGDWLNRCVARDFSVQCNHNARIGIRITQANQCVFENILSTAEYNWTPTTAEPLNTFYIYTVQTCSFRQIDARPNGRGVNCQAMVITGVNTTTSFSDCWIHEASDLLYLTSGRGLQFNNIQFEDGDTGISIGPNVASEFNDCWYESIGGAQQVFVLSGGSPAASQGASVIINGGFYQAGVSNGATYYKSGYNNDAFVGCYGTNKVIIRDLAVLNSMGIANGQLINISGNYNYSIQMDATPIPDIGIGSDYTHVAVDGATIYITTDVGTSHLVVNWANHGCQVGDTITLKGFASSPVSNVKVNQPFYKVTIRNNANAFTMVAVTEILSAASGSTNIGAGDLFKWGGATPINCIIPQPDRVTFNDCKHIQVPFVLTSAGFTTQTAMLCGSDSASGAPGYHCEHDTYLMYAVLSTNIKEAATSTNYCDIFIDSDVNYDSGVQPIGGSQAGSIPTNQWNGGNALIGVRIPAGSHIRVTHTALNDGGAVTFPRTETVTLHLAVCNEATFI